ncbi:putative nuclease HARBI1 isoform X1 [Ixodes scapularis]
MLGASPVLNMKELGRQGVSPKKRHVRLFRALRLFSGLLMLSGLVYQTAGTLVSYLRYPTVVDVLIESTQTLRFPGISVCLTNWLYREHRDAFELPEEIFRKQYRLPKIVVRWLCDELREEPERGWIHFPETPSERFDAEKGFRLLGRIPGVIGCVDGTMVSIVGPSKNDPTVTKAAYWCRKYFYALNVMVVCDADCRIMCIDPRYPGSVHDSFVWQFSWLRNQLEQGQLPRDGRFLLGDSGYPLEPWLITPVPGNHATSTACGRFNKAHSSISAPQHLPCIERARTGVRLRP